MRASCAAASRLSSVLEEQLRRGGRVPRRLRCVHTEARAARRFTRPALRCQRNEHYSSRVTWSGGGQAGRSHVPTARPQRHEVPVATSAPHTAATSAGTRVGRRAQAGDRGQAPSTTPAPSRDDHEHRRDALTTPRAARPGHGLSLGNLLRAEMLKFTSVRALPGTTLAAAAVLMLTGIGISALMVGDASADPGQSPARFFSVPMSGVQLAAVIVAAVGVISMTSDISSGMIRTTFLVAPRRGSVLVAKAVVLAGVIALSQGLAIAATFAVVNHAIADPAQQSSFTDPGVVRALLSSTYLLVGVALVGLALGTLMRSAAAAICTLLGALFVLPIALELLPSSAVVDASAKWWLTATMHNAGDLRHSDSYLDTAVGTSAFTAWILISLTAAAFTLRQRSA